MRPRERSNLSFPLRCSDKYLKVFVASGPEKNLPYFRQWKLVSLSDPLQPLTTLSDGEPHVSVFSTQTLPKVVPGSRSGECQC